MIDQGLRTGGEAAQTKDAFLGGAAAQTHFLGSWRETRIQEVRSQGTGDSRELRALLDSKLADLDKRLIAQQHLKGAWQTLD